MGATSSLSVTPGILLTQIQNITSLTRLAYLATCSTYLVEIYNDLVKQADTFDSLVDVFRVEIRKVGNGSE